MKGLTDGKAGLWLAVAMLAAALMIGLLNTGQTGTGSQEEQRIASVLSAIEGAGRVEVALFYAQDGSLARNDGAPTGAVVVAQGAGDLKVKLSLIRAMRTLLGLDENAVDVFVMEEGRR